MLALIYMVIGSGITVGFHRLLTHRSFKYQPRRARRVRRARLGGRRGPGDRLGRHPPQAPPVLRRGRRPAQPARRTRHRLARRAAGALARPRRLGVLATWRWPTSSRYAKDLLADPWIRFVDRTFVLWVVAGLGVRVRPRRGADRHGHGRAHRAAVGRRGADLLRAPRDLQHQLGVPLLRPTRLRHRRRVAQRRLAGDPDLGRGLAQQPPRVPDLLSPRPRALADRSLGGDHPAAGDDRAGLGRGPGRPRAARAQALAAAPARPTSDASPRWRSPARHRCAASSRPRFRAARSRCASGTGPSVPRDRVAGAPTFTFHSPAGARARRCARRASSGSAAPTSTGCSTSTTSTGRCGSSTRSSRRSCRCASRRRSASPSCARAA